MALIRGPAWGTTPATHALVVGVSRYPYLSGPGASDFGASFNLGDLTSAARSASEVVAWLLTEFRKPSAPLASIRILLSPAPGEELHPLVQARLAEMAGEPSGATRGVVDNNLTQFDAACREDPDNFAFVYIAGHGVQLTNRTAVVLLEDFADPATRQDLGGAIDVAQCNFGMSGGGGYARHQVWFCDSCRQVPEVARRFETLGGAIGVAKQVGEVDASPLFLATGARELAFAELNGVSLFSRALLQAVRGAAASGPDPTCRDWYVGTNVLNKYLGRRVAELTDVHGVSQSVEVAGKVRESVVQEFAEVPQVDVTLTLAPEDASPTPRIALRRNAREPVDVPEGWPVRIRLPAGKYLLDVQVEPPLVRGFSEILDLGPPDLESVHRAEVG